MFNNSKLPTQNKTVYYPNAVYPVPNCGQPPLLFLFTTVCLRQNLISPKDQLAVNLIPAKYPHNFIDTNQITKNGMMH